MLFRIAAALLLAGSAALAPGCSSTLETFRCETNADCASEGSPDGLCERSQVCSFADPSCGAGGRRYGAASGDKSNACVGDDADGPDAAAIADIDAALDEPVDAAVSQADAMPDAMEPTCVKLEMAVYDDNEGDDEVRVLVNGNDAFICAPTAVPIGGDSMAICEYCMPTGAMIRLKADSGAAFQVLITDCAMNCYTEKECEFTASVACNTAHYFDVDFTPLPPPT